MMMPPSEAHRSAAEAHGKDDHGKAHEHSTLAQTRSGEAHQVSQQAHSKSGEKHTKK